MPDVKSKYGSDGVAITCTLASLASSATAGRECTVIDNTTNLFLDALVVVRVKLAAGAPANDQACYVFAYGIVDATAGPTYPDAITGADAAITFNSPTQLRLLGSIYTPTNGGTFIGGPWSVAQCLGGVMPQKWGIAIRNYSGQALTSTESDHKKIYQGIYAQSV